MNNTTKILGKIETMHRQDGRVIRAATFAPKKGKGSYDRKITRNNED